MKRQRTFKMEAPAGDVPTGQTQDTTHACPRHCGRHKTAPTDPNASTVTCYDCVYAVWDRNQWMRTIGLGWAIRPTCANHPDSLGTMQEIPRTGPCPNFRWKKETRGRVTPPKPSSPDIAYIPLTKRKFAIVDKADFERLNKYKWFVLDGRDGQFYAGRRDGYRRISMHRDIMKPPPGMVVHHINGNGLDNRRCNLMICTSAENQRYRPPGASMSGFVGVCREGKKWKATVRRKGKLLYHRYFTDKVEAAKARDDAAAAHFGDAARVNFPRPISPAQPPTPPPNQPQPRSAPAKKGT